MRLVRNKIVSNKILAYWNQIGETNISLDRYMRYRNASRELVFRLWVIPEVYLVGETIARDSMRFLQQQLRIIDPEPKKWDEFNNLTAIAGFISRGTHSKNLKLQYKMACELITILRKEYHF